MVGFRITGIGFPAGFFAAVALFALLLLLHQLRFVVEERHVEAVGVLFGDLQVVDVDALLLDLDGPA